MSNRLSLTFAVFSSALLFAACVADLGDAPGAHHGVGGQNAFGEGGSTGGGTGGTTGSGTGSDPEAPERRAPALAAAAPEGTRRVRAAAPRAA